MLSYGCTRLEIGVQSVYEDVARDTNRGHTVRAVCESFQLAKDAGFKVVAHMMPDLPNVGLERDIEGFIVSFLIMISIHRRVCMYMHVAPIFTQEFFENPAFRADGLKIYPTLVIRGTGTCLNARATHFSDYIHFVQVYMNSGRLVDTRVTLLIF